MSSLHEGSIAGPPGKGNRRGIMYLAWSGLKLAFVANIIGAVRVGALEYRALLLFKTGGANVVGGLGNLYIRLLRINQDSRSKLFKLITGCLIFPVFLGYQICFELVFNLGQIFIFGVSTQHLNLQLDELAVEFQKYVLDFDLLGYVKSAFRHAFGCVYGGKGGGYFGDHASHSIQTREENQA